MTYINILTYTLKHINMTNLNIEQCYVIPECFYQAVDNTGLYFGSTTILSIMITCFPDRS